MSFKMWMLVLGLLGLLAWGMFAGTATMMEAGRAPVNNQLTEIDE